MFTGNREEKGRPVKIKDEGLTLVDNVKSIDFTGNNVVGSAIGDDVTENFDSQLDNIDYIQFNTSATPITNAEGLLQWNATDGTLDLGMSDGDVALQVGQEMVMKVRNNTGATLENGKPVYETGSIGNRPTVDYARSDSESTCTVIGILTEDIPDNEDGYITTIGYVRQIKTNYTGTGIWGTTWAEGDKLYVSKTDAGVLTNVEPSVPHCSDIVGVVGVVGPAGTGSILIKNQLHKTLQNLSDVNGTALDTSGQLPIWDDTNQYFDFTDNINNYFKNGGNSFGAKAILGTNDNFDLGFETNGTEKMTILADGKVGVGTTAPNAPLEIQNTASRGLRLKSTNSGYWDIYTVYSTSDSDLIFNNGSERLRINSSGNVGIGTTSPRTKLDVNGNIYGNGTYAEIHVHDASTAQSIPTGATYTKLTAYTDNGLSNNCTPDATNDKITITKTGRYRIDGSFNFSAGTANTQWLIALFAGGVEMDNIHITRQISTAGDIGSASFTGFIEITTKNTDIDVRARHDNGSAVDLTVQYSNLNVHYIGE